MTSPPSRRRLPLHYQILIAMAVGTVIGISINPGEIPVTGAITLTVIRDGQTITVTESTETGGEAPPEQSVATEPAGSEAARQVLTETRFDSPEKFARSYPALNARLGDLSKVELPVTNGRMRIQHELTGVRILWQRKHDNVPAISTVTARSVDELAPYWADAARRQPADLRSRLTVAVRFLGDLFLRLLKMVTVPLILTSLVTGVAGLGQHGRFGRMFSRTLLYYLATSMLAIVTGVILVNVIRPGVGAILPGGGETHETANGTIGEMLLEQVLRMIPTNPIEAIANGEFLSIISFSILFGLFINLVGGDHGRRLAALFDAAFQVMMRMTTAIISLAPIGVGAFMIYATATQGIAIFGTLAWYMLTVLLALGLHAFVVLPLIVWLVAKRNPLQFARDMSASLLTAFSTASSNAALPLTMNCVEQKAGISNRVSSFVLPLGATINMDGTALYEAVAVLFIAQATPGFDLTIAQQLTVALTALLASVGAAGIPHAGLVMMAIVLQAVGLPLEAQGVIIAVDRILDMCRTTVNVWSDSCGCAVIDQLTNDVQGENAEQGEHAAAIS